MEGADEKRPVRLKVRRNSTAKDQSSDLKQNRECKPNTLRSLEAICACAAWVEEMLLHAGTVVAAKTSKIDYRFHVLLFSQGPTLRDHI